jgi:hypothetical protein
VNNQSGWLLNVVRAPCRGLRRGAITQGGISLQKQVSPAVAIIAVLIVVVVVLAVGYTVFLRKKGGEATTTDEEMLYREQIELGAPADAPVAAGTEETTPPTSTTEGDSGG